MSGNKEYRHALPPGYRFVPAHRHMRVVGPDGELVRCQDGRLLVISKGAKSNTATTRHMLRLLRGLR